MTTPHPNLDLITMAIIALVLFLFCRGAIRILSRLPLIGFLVLVFLFPIFCIWAIFEGIVKLGYRS